LVRFRSLSKGFTVVCLPPLQPMMTARAPFTDPYPLLSGKGSFNVPFENTVAFAERRSS
jgi:hypothetical protein